MSNKITHVQTKPIKLIKKNKCKICGDKFKELNYKLHKQTCNYYDRIILEKRSEKYQRIKTIQKMVKKHALEMCNCKKTGKYCSYEYNELYPILYKVKDAYLRSDTEGNTFVEENISFFETVYNCSQSITQSLKCSAGRDWENSFQETLEIAGLKENIHYSTQVYINNKGIFKKKKDKGANTGHKLDFVIPCPIFDTNINQHKGYIISIKTTTRERVHQDKFLGKFVLITTDDFVTDDDNIMVITPKNDDNQLTIFIKKLLTEYPLL